jgi:shikimate kinase
LATPQYIFDRVLDDKEKRPLIKKHNEAELLFFIEQKLKERESFYNQAITILPVAQLNKDSLSTINC